MVARVDGRVADQLGEIALWGWRWSVGLGLRLRLGFMLGWGLRFGGSRFRGGGVGVEASRWSPAWMAVLQASLAKARCGLGLGLGFRGSGLGVEAGAWGEVSRWARNP